MKFLKLQNAKENSDIKILSLNRPEVKNAFNPEMIAEITNFFKNEANEKKTKLIILKGEGNVFCSGADLNWMKDMFHYSYEENLEDSKKLWLMFEAIQSCETPVVAIAQGSVFGGGLGLLACSDYVYAEAKTQFCFSEVKLGLAPAVISGFISRKIQDAFYRPLMLSAEVFGATDCKQIGLVHRIFNSHVDEGEVIKNFSANGLEAMRETKKLLNQICEPKHSLEAIKNNCIKVISERRISPEGQERLKKFL